MKTTQLIFPFKAINFGFHDNSSKLDVKEFNGKAWGTYLNPIQDGFFRGCLRMGGHKGPLSKICHLYPKVMKLVTVIP